jgi:integrase
LSAHCNGRDRKIEHRTAGEHRCDARCGSHRCRPLSNGTLRKIRSILNDACKRAVRWKWLGTNPLEETVVPPTTRPDPTPPTVEQAARISAAAWKDPDWGVLVWLAMVAGARRGELCALRWAYVDLDAGVLTIRRSVAQSGTQTWEKDTKTYSYEDMPPVPCCPSLSSPARIAVLVVSIPAVPPVPTDERGDKQCQAHLVPRQERLAS